MGRFFRRRSRHESGGTPRPESLDKRLAEAGLGRYALELMALVRPSIRLRPRIMREQNAPGGGSRIGGEPDLPPAARWPVRDGVPQSFIAQIDLVHTHPLDREGVLPDDGLLSFFYDSKQGVWGFDPGDAGAWSVEYAPAGVELVRRRFPDELPREASFAPLELELTLESTPAPWELSEVAALGLSDSERFAYADATEPDTEEGVIHRLLGHPDPIQGDMQLECQLVSHGLYCGDNSGYRDPRAERLGAGAVDWRLLLQIDSDDDAGMMWGDGGRLYFWIHKDALAARRWAETHLVLQCT